MNYTPVFNIYNAPFIKTTTGVLSATVKEQKYVTANDIDIFYNIEQDGGGSIWAADVVSLVQQLYPNRKFHNVFEWCSGPGFIVFSLLANSLCSNLFLVDIYQPALDHCTLTKQNLNNKYQENIVEIIKMGSLEDLTDSYQFDLIVGNPPHFDTVTTRFSKYYDPRLFVDEHWDIHKNFFENVKKNLTKDGIIILLESFWGSSPDTFAQMIDDANLQITKYIEYDHGGGQPLYPLYYLEISHK